LSFIQCFDTVVWVTGRAFFAIVCGGSVLQQVEEKAKGNWLVQVFLEDGH